MAISEKPRPLIQLLQTLRAERIRFILAGMSAANLQGVLAATIDVDIWIGLPSRQYMRVINICRKLGATLRSQNKVYLSDDTPVDFIYEISGLTTFDKEYSRSNQVSFHGLRIPVLPLERIIKSKKAAARDKDKLHIILIRQTLRVKRAAVRRLEPLKATTRRARRKG